MQSRLQPLLSHVAGTHIAHAAEEHDEQLHRARRLGAIAAFAECVGSGSKRLALSSPMTAADMSRLYEEAAQIATQNGCEITVEADFLVTDLFPAATTDGL